jgi:excisionase family DNA binding protein
MSEIQGDLMRFSSETPDAAPQRWLSLGSACRLLGVNESTMRRWADAGQVRTFRTPGGHRRFAEGDIHLLLAGRADDGFGGRFDEIGSVALTRIRRQIERGRGHDAPWYLSVEPEARERLRPLGRRLVGLLSQYVGRRSRRQALLHEARKIGEQYGRELADAGVSLSHAVEALLFFRKNLDEAARQVDQRRHSVSAEDLSELREQIVSQADQVLLGLTSAYDDYYRQLGAAVRAAPGAKER